MKLTLTLLLLASGAFGQILSGVISANGAVPQVATPAFSQEGGACSPTCSITITDTDSGLSGYAAQYCTNTGSDCTPGTAYSSAVTVSVNNTHLCAFADATGRGRSSTHCQTFTVAGSTAPTLGTAVSGLVGISGGNLVLTAVTASAGDALFVGFGAAGSSESTCDEINSVTSNLGATFTKTPSGTLGNQTAACAKGWIAYGVSAGNHVITIVDSLGLSAVLTTITYVVVPIHPGSLASITDQTCSGHSAGPSATCSSMTPTSSVALALSYAFAFASDAGTFTAGTGYAIPTSGQINTGSFGTGSAAFEFKVLSGTPPLGAESPAFTGPSGGDGQFIVGGIIR